MHRERAVYTHTRSDLSVPYLETIRSRYRQGPDMQAGSTQLVQTDKGYANRAQAAQRSRQPSAPTQ